MRKRHCYKSPVSLHEYINLIQLNQIPSELCKNGLSVISFSLLGTRETYDPSLEHY